MKAELTTPYEYRITAKSGEICTFMETVTPIYYRGERAVLGNVMNITDRKMLESQMAQSQKLEAIGQLAAGIAHELNTPIQYVGDNITFLRDAFQDSSRFSRNTGPLSIRPKKNQLAMTTIDDIIARVEQKAGAIDLGLPYRGNPPGHFTEPRRHRGVTKIVRAMKEFSHPGTKEKTLTDINKAIGNTITVSRNEWKYMSEMETDFDPPFPLCLASRGVQPGYPQYHRQCGPGHGREP